MERDVPFKARCVGDRTLLISEVSQREFDMGDAFAFSRSLRALSEVLAADVLARESVFADVRGLFRCLLRLGLVERSNQLLGVLESGFGFTSEDVSLLRESVAASISPPRRRKHDAGDTVEMAALHLSPPSSPGPSAETTSVAKVR